MDLTKTIFGLLLGRRLPTVSGTLQVDALHGSVTIRRDSYGIPHIDASHPLDAWYAIGFSQGQDRAFRIELQQRLARGTLSELIGKQGLALDRLARRIGFYSSARRQLDVLDPEIVEIIEAFANGVTAGTAIGCKRKPHEYVLLRSDPIEYTTTDVVAVSKLQSFALAGNWDVELARLHILRRDGPKALRDVDPTYLESHPLAAPPGAPAGAPGDRLHEDLKLLASVAGGAGGSNSWALAPARTSTGRPILANDAHLPGLLPIVWYLAHAHAPGMEVAGALLTGMPGFAAGHNGFAAWGLTAGFADNTDLFLEEIGPGGKSVRDGDGFVDCPVRREDIRVKGSEDVVEEVLETPRGPIVSPLFSGVTDAVSLRATWLDAMPIEGYLSAHTARSLEEFRSKFERWPLMSLNVTYADENGSTGWMLVGEVPKRKSGYGTVPTPGWADETGWEDDYVPLGEMPYVVDPPDDMVVTANNQPSLDGEGRFLGADWVDGFRAARLFEALQTRDDWDPKSTRRLQMDLLSAPWQRIRDVVLGISPRKSEARIGQAMLADWDGELSPESPAASVFVHFMDAISRRTMEAKVPQSVASILGKGPFSELPIGLLAARRAGSVVRLLSSQPSGWFSEPWSTVVEESLAEAVKRLTERYGEDREGWAWGRIRPLTLRHPIGERKPFDRVFNLGPIPLGGDGDTVAQAMTDPSNATSNPIIIPSIRMVVDVGDWDNSSFSIPGGQSGNPLSPHYSDQLPLWQQGEGVAIAWSEEAVEQATVHTLTLEPAV